MLRKGGDGMLDEGFWMLLPIGLFAIGLILVGIEKIIKRVRGIR